MIREFEGLDVGDRVRVGPIGTDVDRGFFDFAEQEEGRGMRFARPGRRIDHHKSRNL